MNWRACKQVLIQNREGIVALMTDAADRFVGTEGSRDYVLPLLDSPKLASAIDANSCGLGHRFVGLPPLYDLAGSRVGRASMA